LFYGHGLNPEPLYFAAVAVTGLFIMNRTGVSNPAGYILLGLVMWAGVLESGVHATLAGVLTALFIPLRCRKSPAKRPLKKLEHGLHRWVAFGVLPIFAFANAGVPLAGLGVEDMLHPVTVGIALGLFAGKQIGVF